MIIRHNRTAALLLALLVMFSTAFPVYAEGGDGSGGGDGQDKPLVLAKSSIPNGAENVDPNIRIVLTFTKNVVNFVVRENNMKCFTVRDSKGNAFPITVEMGDDQIDPDIKRIVTVSPQSPYLAGETYILIISRDLAAKNGRDKLDKDVYISFTIREANSTSTVSPSPSPAVTTTTTKPTTETTTKRATTTRPPITAATRSSTTTGRTEEQTTVSTTTSQSLPAASERSFYGTPTEASMVYADALTTHETMTEAVLRSEPAAAEETTAPFETHTVSTETGTIDELQQSEDVRSEKRLSSTLCLGIIIAIAGIIAIISIIKSKEKKG